MPASLHEGYAKVEQLYEILEEFTSSYPPGTRLPSERELADHYGVARMTARQAIDGLAAKGLVYRLRGNGTFVAEPRLSQPERLTSFSEDMAARGMRASSIILAQEVVEATPMVASKLEISARARVIKIERVRCGDGRPIALERTYLPARRFPGLEEADLADASLYRLLDERYGCEVCVARQRVTLVKLSTAEAHLLGADVDQPSFSIERVTGDSDGATIEYVRSLYPGDRYELRTQLERLPSATRQAVSRTEDDGSRDNKVRFHN
jgi:GntR family transcriptional regulator